MTKAANIESIEKATGRAWAEWLAYMESIKADKLSHKEIAGHVREELKGELENGGWWAQGVTVAYEQHIGRRNPGQRSDGTYEVSATKTLGGSMDEGMEAWLGLVKGRKDFAGIAITKAPTSTQTDKRRHWACGLQDGTRVNADVSLRSSGTAMIAVTHSKLDSQNAAETWRAYWKSQLAEL